MPPNLWRPLVDEIRKHFRNDVLNYPEFFNENQSAFHLAWIEQNFRRFKYFFMSLD
jgi:hypothetical protein